MESMINIFLFIFFALDHLLIIICSHSLSLNHMLWNLNRRGCLGIFGDPLKSIGGVIRTPTVNTENIASGKRLHYSMLPMALSRLSLICASPFLLLDQANLGPIVPRSNIFIFSMNSRACLAFLEWKSLPPHFSYFSKTSYHPWALTFCTYVIHVIPKFGFFRRILGSLNKSSQTCLRTYS